MSARLVLHVTSTSDVPAAAVGVWDDRGAAPFRAFVAAVEATFDADGALEWSEEPALRAQTRADDGTVLAGHDVVPGKGGRVDLLLHGGVTPAFPASRVDAAVRVGGREVRVQLRASAPAAWLPLRPPYAFAADGVQALTLEPRAVPLPALPSRLADHDGLAAFAAGPEELDLAGLGAVDAIELEGLAGDGVLRLPLPDLAPQLVLERSGVDQYDAVELALDTVAIDLRARTLRLLYRGRWDVPLGWDDAVRAVLVLDRAGARRDPDAVLRDLPRARVSFVATPDDLRTGPRDEEERRTLEIARYETWGHEEAPAPTLPLELFARISAELAERTVRREIVLAQYGLEDYEFQVEERAWLERIGRAATEGDGTLAETFGKSFEEAQAALAAGDPPGIDLELYARVAAQLEVAEDAGKVLEGEGLWVPRWQRLEARVDEKAGADPAFAEQVSRALQAARDQLATGSVVPRGSFAIPSLEEEP